MCNGVLTLNINLLLIIRVKRHVDIIDTKTLGMGMKALLTASSSPATAVAMMELVQ